MEERKAPPARLLMKYSGEKNIAASISEDELGKIGQRVIRNVELDEQSMADWRKKNRSAMNLAMQVSETKNTPWANASNVKYPLITTAAMQFNARAYAAIVQGKQVVKGKVTGSDPQGVKLERADRVSKCMNYQLLDQMAEWETDTDRLLLALPICGCYFKKTYFDGGLGRPVSELINLDNMIVNYNAKRRDQVRLTQRVPLNDNQIHERKAMGLFLEDFDPGTPDSPDGDEDAPHTFFEQHWKWDLDGDGYKEPYIVTVHEKSQKVVRIVAGYDPEGVFLVSPEGEEMTLQDLFKAIEQFQSLSARREQLGQEFMQTGDPNIAAAMVGFSGLDEKMQSAEALIDSAKVVKIHPVEYYTKYEMFPAPDGGFLGIGLGTLLVPINEVVDTTINQMIDAATLANMGGGFKSKGLKMQGGPVSFQIGEYKEVDNPGDDLRKHILPMPFPGPNATLFNLLGLMIDAGKDVSSIKDVMLGDLPQGDVPATTTMAAVEQVQKLFTGIYKRLHRSLKDELTKLYRIDRMFLSQEEYQTILDDPQANKDADFAGGDCDIQPISDPTIASELQKMLKAQGLMQYVGDPLVNQVEIRKRQFEAMDQPNVELLLQVPPPPPDPKQVEMEMKMKLEAERLMIEARESEARIKKLYADTILSLAKAEGEEAGVQMEQYKQQVEGIRVLLDAAQMQREAMQPKPQGVN